MRGGGPGERRRAPALALPLLVAVGIYGLFYVGLDVAHKQAQTPASLTLPKAPLEAHVAARTDQLARPPERRRAARGAPWRAPRAACGTRSY